MSTRACYTFIEEGVSYNVYQHYDGYPFGAVIAIRKALDYAWPLPRFEADEFGAAFIAGNKETIKPGMPRQFQGGGVRLLRSGNWKDAAPGDIEYRYEIGMSGGSLTVKALQVREKDDVWTEKVLFNGTFDRFGAWVEKEAAKDRA